MKIRTKLAVTYAAIIILILLIVSFVFDGVLVRHADKVFSEGLPKIGASRPMDLGRPFIDAVRKSLWLAALGAGSFAIILTFVISNYIVSPIKKLIKATEKIAGGEYDCKLEFDTRDELSDLANALNVMSSKLEEVETLRRELVANVSHELATPLTNIKGYLEALSDGLIKGKKREETFDLLKDETDRLVGMVQDVRELAISEGKNLKLDFENVDVAVVIKKVVEKMKPQFQKRKMVLELENMAPVKADPGKLEQILVNLLSNASKFTKDGDKISIQLHKSAGRKVLKVIDSGFGISKKDIPYIFERFYRGDKSRSRSTGGTGVGLAIVKELVERHGWKIAVESVVNEGSSFVIFLD